MMIPNFRNSPGTASPSRRSAISHKLVASEPVTERLGPRSSHESKRFSECPLLLADQSALLP